VYMCVCVCVYVYNVHVLIFAQTQILEERWAPSSAEAPRLWFPPFYIFIMAYTFQKCVLTLLRDFMTGAFSSLKS
jgi:hypothetical protein